MKTAEEIKLEWQKHNQDHGMSWNEVAELVNEVVASFSTLNRDKVMEVLISNDVKPSYFPPAPVERSDHMNWNLEYVGIFKKQLADAICSLTVPLPTEEEIDKVIDDICILEERITFHYQKTFPPAEEIDKLQVRQRNAILNLLNQQR